VIDQQGVIRWQRVGNMDLAGEAVIVEEVESCWRLEAVGCTTGKAGPSCSQSPHDERRKEPMVCAPNARPEKGLVQWPHVRPTWVPFQERESKIPALKPTDSAERGEDDG
jgi:hypothetical protein